MVVVIIQLIVLFAVVYVLGIHTEKIGWLEDKVLGKRGGDLSWVAKADEKAVVREVENDLSSKS